MVLFSGSVLHDSVRVVNEFRGTVVHTLSNTLQSFETTFNYLFKEAVLYIWLFSYFWLGLSLAVTFIEKSDELF